MLQLLDGITQASILFVVGSGLLLVFGVMNIMNLAHGAFLLVGAYAALAVTQEELSPWLGFALAPLVGLVLGAVTELVLIRRLAGRPLDAILATWGLGIVITQMVVLQYGRGVQFVEAPIRGTVQVLGESYSSYRLFTLALACALGLALVGVVRFTTWGLTARAVIMNPELARALGINTAAVRLVTFSLGAALAALAGAMLTPMFSVDPNMGLPWLVAAFMAVLVAGPSVIGLAFSAILLGGAQTLAGFYLSPVIGSVAVVVIAVAILRLLPTGFAGLSLKLPRSAR